VKPSTVRSAAFAVFLSVILMLSVTYYWPIQEAYHPLNSGWNGCSEAAGLTKNGTLVMSYDKPLPNGSSLLAIIGPSLNFSRSDSSRISSFLEGGGTVLLADDFGTGNTLLEAVNASVRLSGKPFLDLYYYSKNASFPLVSDFSPGSLTANITTILLNRPSNVLIGNSSQVTILASSSPFSFTGRSGDNRPSPNNPLTSYPVIVETKIGRGLLVLISDPDLFTNEMIVLYDNMKLFQNLLVMGHGSLFFDVAHLATAPLTNLRASLRDQLRDILIFLRESLYVPLLIALALVLGFSFELFIVRRRQAGK
jgi:hypothetical protein